MKTPRAWFTDHPATVGETYLEHLAMAGSFGLRMLGGGLACLLHGLLPFLFTTTGSRTVADLHRRMLTHRRASASPLGRDAAPL